MDEIEREILRGHMLLWLAEKLGTQLFEGTEDATPNSD